MEGSYDAGVDGWPAGHNPVYSRTNSVCEVNEIGLPTEKRKVHNGKTGLGLCTHNDNLNNSKLSVHSVMVTDQEKSSYMGSIASASNEKLNVSGKNLLQQYKNTHGLSVDCIDKESRHDVSKKNNSIKMDFKEFNHTKLSGSTKHSLGKGKYIQPSSSKRQDNGVTYKRSPGRSPSHEEDSKCSLEKKGQKKRRRSSAQSGLVLDVAKLHDSGHHGKRKNSKDGGSPNDNTFNNSDSKTPSPKARLSPSLLVTPSPTPSRKSMGVESDASSIYHSSSVHPLSDRRSSDGQLLSMQRDLNVSSKKLNKMTSLSVTPPRVRSSMGTLQNKDTLPPPTYLSLRRASAAADYVFRTSLPYIPSGKSLSKLDGRENADDMSKYDNEQLEPGLLCAPKWGNVCGRHEEKDINDQTCRSNFGMVLSGLCFVLFLWYLGIVYSRFINKALSFDAFDSISSAEPGPIQEVVINISADDLKLVSTESGSSVSTYP